MKSAGLCLLVLAGMILNGGCGSGEIATTPTSSTVEVDGFSVSLDIPARTLTRGESFSVTVTATNSTKRPMQIVSTSGTPVYVRISRHTGLVWEVVKTYPEASTMIMNPWTLDRESSRSFVMQLTVEPDWPRGEPLRLTAEINGRSEIAPGITVEVTVPTEP